MYSDFLFVAVQKRLQNIAQTPAQNLNFNAHLPEHPIILKADANLLKQAVINLLTNAFKYTPADGKVELHLFPQSHDAVRS